MASKNDTKQEKAGSGRLEQGLAFTAIGVIGLSLISMFISLISSLFGAKENLVILAQIPLLGLPLGFILVLVLLVTSLVRRSRENGN